MNNTQLSDHIRKFEEMEAAFQKNHDEIERASGRMDTLEDRITRTMSACEKLSSQVATMDSRFTSMFEKLEMLLIARIPTTQHTDPQEMILTQDNNSITDEQIRTTPTNCDDSTGSDTATHQSHASTISSIHIKSPEKKKPRPTPRNSEDTDERNDGTTAQDRTPDATPKDTDQTGDQYTIFRPSDEREHG